MKKQLLVPTDFTKVAQCAVDHALEIAKTIDGELTLLHVVEDDDKLAEAESKLATEVARVQSGTEVVVKSIGRKGNIFEDIGDVASEIKASLIVMGTHGLRGFQFLTGSHALKVITNSKVPFIVVQERPIRVGYNNIVAPLDLSKATKQKLTIVANMASYFDSKIHLITPYESDEYLNNQLTRNMSYATGFFAARDIEFTATIAPEKGSFEKNLIEFSTQQGADLIAIMNMQENSLLGMLGSSYEQHLITNEAQIPVMIMNPSPATVSGGSVLFT